MLVGYVSDAVVRCNFKTFRESIAIENIICYVTMRYYAEPYRATETSLNKQLTNFPGNYFSGWNKNSTHTLKREWDICSKETYPTDNPSLAGVSVEEARTAAAACTRTRQSIRCRKRQLPLILQQHTGWSAGGMLPGHAGPRQDCPNQSVIPRTLQPLIQAKGRFNVTSSWCVQKWKVVHKHFSKKNFLKCQRCLLFTCSSLWSLVTLYLTSNYLVCDLYLPLMWPQFTSYLYSPRIWPLFTS